MAILRVRDDATDMMVSEEPNRWRLDGNAGELGVLRFCCLVGDFWWPCGGAGRTMVCFEEGGSGGFFFLTAVRGRVFPLGGGAITN